MGDCSTQIATSISQYVLKKLPNIYSGIWLLSFRAITRLTKTVTG